MHAKKRYKEILFILDTCEAFTLFDSVNHNLAPNIFFIGSSVKDQKASSINYDKEFMTPLADRFSYLLFNSIERILKSGNLNIEVEQIFAKLRRDPLLKSDVATSNTVKRKILFKDYFGNSNFYRNKYYESGKIMIANKNYFTNNLKGDLSETSSFISDLNNSLVGKIKDYHKISTLKNAFYEVNYINITSREKKNYVSQLQFICNSLGFFFVGLISYSVFVW
jgi:glycosylphosphatidylinositol transamidase (GPIT) subunit GPI8